MAGFDISDVVFQNIANPNVTGAFKGALGSLGDLAMQRREDRQLEDERAREDELLSMKAQQKQEEEARRQEVNRVFSTSRAMLQMPYDQQRMRLAQMRNDALAQQDMETVAMYDEMIAMDENALKNDLLEDVLYTGQELGIKQKDIFDTLPKDAMTDEMRVKLSDEVRGTLRPRVAKINNAISDIRQNYEKVTGLAKEVDKGNRPAVAQLMVSTVKLGEPGSTVTEKEMAANLNQEGLLPYLLNNGVSPDMANTIIAKLDPLGPGTIKTDDVKAVANVLISAGTKNIIDDYRSAKEDGSALERKEFDSVFAPGIERRVSEFERDFMKKGGEAPPQLPPGSVQNPDGTITLPDGRIIRRRA